MLFGYIIMFAFRKSFASSRTSMSGCRGCAGAHKHFFCQAFLSAKKSGERTSISFAKLFFLQRKAESAQAFLLPGFSFCKEKRLNTLGQLFAPLSAEFCKPSFIQCLADFNHQIVVEPQIVHDSQTLSKHFAGL